MALALESVKTGALKSGENRDGRARRVEVLQLPIIYQTKGLLHGKVSARQTGLKKAPIA